MAFLVKVFQDRWVFMLQKPEAFSASSLLALLADKGVSSLFLLQCHTYLPTAMFPITMVMHSNPLESQTWIKSFLLQVVLAMVFYHNRKVSKSHMAIYK